jgi:hypothetical protein
MAAPDYWARVRRRAKELKSDGCSGVPDFHLDCCLEHDIAYRTGHTVDGEPLTRAEADARLRRCIQKDSSLGVLDPMSWWRWAGVRLFGASSWWKS